MGCTDSPTNSYSLILSARSSEYSHSIGCYADVMTYMDAQCSGRRSCSILIATLEAVAQPCDKDFKSYLQATYRCVQGEGGRGAEGREGGREGGRGAHGATFTWIGVSWNWGQRVQVCVFGGVWHGRRDGGGCFVVALPSRHLTSSLSLSLYLTSLSLAAHAADPHACRDGEVSVNDGNSGYIATGLLEQDMAGLLCRWSIQVRTQ